MELGNALLHRHVPIHQIDWKRSPDRVFQLLQVNILGFVFVQDGAREILRLNSSDFI
jgi:hypothetical protein